jgi:hypothetical protein
VFGTVSGTPPDGLDKGVIVSGLVKDGLSTITTVEDVVPHPDDGRSGSSWHPTIIKQTGLSVNIRYVPFSSLQCLLYCVSETSLR